jgi:hypothetical protein
MAFGRRNVSDTPAGSSEHVGPLESYDVTYKGGLLDLPKSKVGKIKMEIYPDRFMFLPTLGSKKFWPELNIPHNTISDLKIVERTVSTFEGLAGGINSRQLNQKNNIQITYAEAAGDSMLRLEMLSGVTVMGQANKCNELEDRLRTLHIREKFVASVPAASAEGGGLVEELGRLASLRESDILTEEEFVAAKARLLDA